MDSCKHAVSHLNVQMKRRMFVPEACGAYLLDGRWAVLAIARVRKNRFAAPLHKREVSMQAEINGGKG